MTESTPDTITGCIEHWAATQPQHTWLRDRRGDSFADWTWRQAADEVASMAAWLESILDDAGTTCAILSRNRAHWVLADMAVVASGNVTVPMFTTLPPDTAKYILEFAGVKVLFLGESENWDSIRAVVPDEVLIVTLPGVQVGGAHVRWEDQLVQFMGRTPGRRCSHDALMSIVFTSGTTGEPKGVMHSHDSMLIPMRRCRDAFQMRAHPRFLSYLPLSHVAERQAVLMQSLIYGGTITFNESIGELLRDVVEARPTFFFGAPRVWEQLRQRVQAHFGSQEALEKALQDEGEGAVQRARALVGLEEADYLLTGAAPAYEGLLSWWARIGLPLMDGYGQTEAMGLIGSTSQHNRLGSIGKPVDGVEARISESGELLCRAEGMAMGYYRRPKETGETFVDGWIHTGDRARVDDDGFYYITGRVQDYFKTIHGKYVAPAPMEGEFSSCPWVEQLCLLGRGYSKTVMVCVLSREAQAQKTGRVESDLRAQAEDVNRRVERHARIGALILLTAPWTVANGILTATLKIRRMEVEGRYGYLAQELAWHAAERGELLVRWADTQHEE